MEHAAAALVRWAGSTSAFICAAGLVIAWALSGPFFGYSAAWQMAINSSTTVITFLMVFLIHVGRTGTARPFRSNSTNSSTPTQRPGTRLLGSTLGQRLKSSVCETGVRPSSDECDQVDTRSLTFGGRLPILGLFGAQIKTLR